MSDYATGLYYKMVIQRFALVQASVEFLSCYPKEGKTTLFEEVGYLSNGRVFW